MKKVLYIRCSTLDQNPALQINDIASNFSLSEYDTVSENESAWKENVKRPEFDRLIDMIKKGKVAELYVWDLDRIHRNLNRLKEFFLLCKTFNCKIHSYNQKWLDDLNSIPAPFNDMMFDLMVSLLGWLAESESSKKSGRVKMAVVRKEKGTFSYKGNLWGRKPFPKQTHSRVIELHQQGKSLREIANEVLVYDKNNNSRPISKSAVHKIIGQNPQ